MSISSVPFNTTNVRALDSIGKLYKIDLPGSASSADGEALVYSATTIANNKLAPASAIYLTTTDAADSYFSFNRAENQSLNLVASGDGLNLYVYTPENKQEPGSTGHLDKYSFDSTGVLIGESSLTNSIEIAREEQSLSIPRDLDANSVVGGKLSATGSLDKIGSLYKVNVAGEDLFVVGTAPTTKSKVINVADNVLKSNESDGDNNPKAWQPEGIFNSYNAFKNTLDNSWDIFAFNATQKSVTQFSFDADKVLKSEFKDGRVLSVAEVANEEISRKRNLNGDAVLGMNILPTAIDPSGGLFKASIQGEDYYLVGNNLKSGNKATAPVFLRGALINESGETSWQEPSGSIIRSIYQNPDGQSVQVYATKSIGLDTQVLRFNFSFNEDSKNYLLETAPEGMVLNAFELAKDEKIAGRDLDKSGEFGISVKQGLDKVGGLSLVSSMGQDFLVSGNNLVSNSKKITDLTNALTIDGGAWIPEGFTANEVRRGDLVGKISIVLESDLRANVYVNDGSSISKYYFERDQSSSPWTTTEGSKNLVSIEELASLEKTTRRDLNGDGFYGAKIVEQKNVAGGLYAASLSSLGSALSNISDASKIFIRSDYKLALGGTVAKNAVDFSNALISNDGYWAPPEGYKITGAFRDGETYSVIIKNETTPSDIKKYTFEISAQTKLIENDDPSFTYDISAKDLSTLEFNLKRDLNADGIAGVKIKGNPTDKVGGLYKVQASDGEYYVNKVGSAAITNLDNAFLDENSNRWEPSTEENRLKKLTLITNSETNDYLIYQSEFKGTNTIYSKYTFDANRVLTGKTQLSLTDVANEESALERDINGDGVFGAKVISTIKANSGIYKVAIDDKFMLIAPGTDTPAGRTADLSTVLMADDTNPLEISSDGLLKGSEFNGFRVFSGFKSTNSDGLNTIKIFAIKSNLNPQTGQSFNDVKMLTFKETSLSDSTPPKNIFLSTQDLSAEEIMAEEKASGLDLNADKAVGVKIDQVIDKKVGLYSSTILGQTYYFVDSPNKKSGTDSLSAIDLRRAFYDENSSPWTPAIGNGNSSVTPTIAGVVELTDSEDKKIGYDIYTFTRTDNVFSVFKHSWTLDDADGLVYKTSTEVDTAELVKVEVDKKRDLSGDGVVGFRAASSFHTDPTYEGVTKVAVLGSSSESFYVVGKNLRPGTPTNPWKLSDALLNEEGTGAWTIPNETNLIKSIAAVRDANSTDRFVYVKTLDQSADISVSYITKYKFKKADGTFTGESQRLDDVSLAAEELNSKRDLNSDGKLGVVQFTDVKLNNEEYGTRNFYDQVGKSSGLISTTINNVNYLVVKKAPSSNTLLNLDLALFDSNGAWKPSDTFKLLGVYKNSTTDETEVYGNELDESASTVFKKYTFSITNLESLNPLEDYPQGIIPKVLMLNTDVSSTISSRSIAERENVIGKDLNNDNVFGFALDRSPNSRAVEKISSLANGTTMAKSSYDGEAIYVVGKSISSMGSTANRTANNNALRQTIDDVQGYWKPDTGYVVKSILESTASSSVKVYAQLETDPSKLREYSFNRVEGSGADGWTHTATDNLNAAQVVNLEITSLKDLNGDGTFGLNYKTASQTIDGLLKTSMGNGIHAKDFYFATTPPKGNALLGFDESKLLTKANGDPWNPVVGDTPEVFDTEILNYSNAPVGAAFALSDPLNNKVTFFSSEFKELE